jgi:hypothetical protein
MIFSRPWFPDRIADGVAKIMAVLTFFALVMAIGTALAKI